MHVHRFYTTFVRQDLGSRGYIFEQHHAPELPIVRSALERHLSRRHNRSAMHKRRGLRDYFAAILLAIDLSAIYAQAGLDGSRS